MIRTCIECGKVFTCSPSDKIVTCSPECKKKRRRKILKNHKTTEETRKKMSERAKIRGYSENLQKGTLAAVKSPKAGRFETNSSAKEWVLLSPEKEIFRCTNLNKWIRENSIEFFGVEPTDENVTRIASGFRVIKKNLKRKTGTITYKDWTLLDWSDEKNCEKQKKQN